MPVYFRKGQLMVGHP